ncbi:MAG: phenylacetate--CoA ligase family protein [Ignavibacteriae bacterium]|nr:phenylacetate--CoA ligase family protein [Ignavibacteriota bacterium]
MNWRKSISYPIISKLQGSSELSHLSDLIISQFYSKSLIEEVQNEKFKNLILNASQNVPYYKKLFKEHGNLSSVKNLNDLSQIPILHRKSIQENYRHFFSDKLNGNEFIETSSGGSTGNPVKLIYSKDTFYRRSAAAKRHDSWANFEFGDKQAIIWGARRDFKKLNLKSKILNYLTNNILIFDSSSISDNELEQFLHTLNKFKPKNILGYAQSLVYVADYINSTNFKLYPPNSIISSAELLTSNDKEKIENAFNAKVFNRYGARETSVIASECEFHNMHVRDEDIILEIVREDGSKCDIGEEGEILITDLINHAFPVIRYKIGDTAVRTKENCPCGRNLSTIKISSGRITDFILTPLNKKVSGVAAIGYLCANIEGLAKVQFHQKEVGTVLVNIVPNKKFDFGILPHLNESIKKFLDNIETKIEIVDEINTTSSGKFRPVINEILNKN